MPTPVQALVLLAAPFAAHLPADTVEVCAANIRNHTVTCYDVATGARTLTIEPGAGGLQGPTGIVFSPGGDIVVASSMNDRILRFDGRTGAFMGAVVEDSALATPFTIVYGADADLYVSSGTGHVVTRYDGRTGERWGVVAGGPALRTPIGLAFDAEGMLLVANAGGREVARFDPATGERVGGLTADSLSFPSDVVVEPGGDVLVSSAANGMIIRFDGETGAFAGVYGRLPEGGVPVGIRRLPDGGLVVADFGRDRLFRFPPGGGEPTLITDQGLAGPENVEVRVRRR